MTRNLKTMGLALVAVFAMSAVVASTASATNDLFTTPEGGTTTLTGHQEGKNKLTIVGQAVECTVATFHAKVSGTTSTQVTVTPTYSGCSLAGVPATIDLNGCKYLLTGNTDPNGHAQVHIVDCEIDKHITITITGLTCDITVKEKMATDGNQTATEGVRYTNVGIAQTKEVTIDLTAKVKITVDTWPNPSANPICEEIEPATTARLTGQVLVTGEIGIAHTPIEVSA